MFRHKNKIIAISMVILLVVVSLLSVSFSIKVTRVSSSFACTTNVAIEAGSTQVVKTVVDIDVGTYC